MQQPTAFFRAYAVMDAKYLTGGLLHKGDFQEMAEHSPIAQWKDWGYYQLDLGRTTKEILLGQEGFGRRLTEFFMKPAGAMDNLTWTRLWNACKLEIEDTTDFQKGSKKYWKAVSERFDEVIDRTQVVDSVLHRSQMMRSTDGLTRMYTSFMAEPTKTYNLMRSTGVDLMQRKPGAGKAFARAAVAVLASSAATAAAAAILDAARGAGEEDDDKGFWGRYREATVENFTDQINPAGWNPYLKDFLSLFQGYEAKRTDMAPVADVVKAFSVLRRAQAGEGKVTTEAAMAELLFKLSKVFGLPVANLKRDVTAAVNTVLDGLQANGVNTYGVRFRWDMFKTAQNEDTAGWWMEQGFAARDAGDSETAERIFQMLHDKQLKTRKEIRDYERNVHGKEKNELVKLAYEAQLDGDGEGSQLYSDALREMGMDDSDIEKALGGKAEQAATDEFGFRDYRSDVEIRIQDEAYESRIYETLGAKQRERFESYVRDYGGKMTKEAKFEDFEIDDQWMFACRDAKQKCGLSESQFMMARAAANCVESIKDKDGETIANSKGLRKMQAIYEIPGLNDKQRAYLFEACGVGKSIQHYNKAKVKQALDKMERQAAK